MRRAVAALLLLLALPARAEFPSFEAVRAAWQPSDAVLLDRHGEVLHRLRVDPQGRRLEWTPLAEVSPALPATLIQAEDKRFYEHGGVDWKALLSAALDTLVHDRPRGASTLTMQLAALLDPALMPAGRHRTLEQKWDQIQAARALEQAWSKPQILEAYLNLASYRGEYQGVAAASRGLFGKAPGGLTEAEALLLSALLRAPNAAPDKVAERACRLAETAGARTGCAAIRAQAALLGRPGTVAPDEAGAPFVARRLLKPGTLSARTALDGELQRFAAQALDAQLRQLAARHVGEGAVLVVDNRSGEVLAYVSGGPDSRNVFVDGVQASRQAGSTLKPFLYGLALEERRLTAASLLDDAPVNLATPYGLYVPQNYEHDFQGLVSVRLALGSSLNVPAVKTLLLTGADPFVERLRRLGFAGVVENGDFYGFSLALGSADVSLWELVNAYRTLANGGLVGPLSLVPGGHPPGERVMERDAAFVVGDILADRAARSLTFGLESALAARSWAAVKTGTSKDMRDNWCVGFSDRYTVGVWVGNFDGSPMRDVSGVSGAAPVWREVMAFLHRGAPARAPAPPPGVVRAEVHFEPPVEAARPEWFLAGTEVERVALAPATRSAARIRYPADGSILALDPDIPPGRQAVFFTMEPADPALRWRLDESDTLPAGGRWAPTPGHHVLRLVDGGGEELDRVGFEVRGSPRAR